MKMLLVKIGMMFLMTYYLTHLIVFFSTYSSGAYATIISINSKNEAHIELGLLILTIIPASHLLYYVIGDPPIIGYLIKSYLMLNKKKRER